MRIWARRGSARAACELGAISALDLGPGRPEYRAGAPAARVSAIWSPRPAEDLRAARATARGQGDIAEPDSSDLPRPGHQLQGREPGSNVQYAINAWKVGRI